MRIFFEWYLNVGEFAWEWWFENIWELYLEVEEFVWEPWNSDLDLYYSRQQRQQSSDVIIIIVIIVITIVFYDNIGILWQSETSSSERNLTWAPAGGEVEEEHHVTSYNVNFSHHDHHIYIIIYIYHKNGYIRIWRSNSILLRICSSVQLIGDCCQL